MNPKNSASGNCLTFSMSGPATQAGIRLSFAKLSRILQYSLFWSGLVKGSLILLDIVKLIPIVSNSGHYIVSFASLLSTLTATQPLNLCNTLWLSHGPTSNHWPPQINSNRPKTLTSHQPFLFFYFLFFGSDYHCRQGALLSCE